MRPIFLLLLLCNLSIAQEPDQFTEDAKSLLESLKGVGDGQLPEGIEAAKDLAAIKNLRVRAAEKNVSALQIRFARGQETSKLLLAAQIELTLAKIDTTESREEQAEHIRHGLMSTLIIWQRAKKMADAGVGLGGDLASVEQQVLKYLVWWHKWKAGEDLGVASVEPNVIESEQAAPVIACDTRPRRAFRSLAIRSMR